MVEAMVAVVRACMHECAFARTHACTHARTHARTHAHTRALTHAARTHARTHALPSAGPACAGGACVHPCWTWATQASIQAGRHPTLLGGEAVGTSGCGGAGAGAGFPGWAVLGLKYASIRLPRLDMLRACLILAFLFCAPWERGYFARLVE